MKGLIRHQALDAQQDAVSARFASRGAAQFHDAVDATMLRNLLEPSLGALQQIAVRNELRDHLDGGRLLLGGRHSRVDPGHPSVDEARGEQMAQVLRSQGIDSAAADMAAEIQGVVQSVTGTQLRYARAQVLLYGARDYLGPHTDTSSGSRYNVQTAITWNCLSGLRMFGTSGPDVLPDWPGVLRVLGPAVWHEVLPLIPVGPLVQARRVVLSLRFESAQETGAPSACAGGAGWGPDHD